MLRPTHALLGLCAVFAGTARAEAPPSGVATYALVVGSNLGGPGQQELRYAEDDARRVGALLTELGGYTADRVDVVLHPTPQIVRDRLANLAVRVQADIAAGKQARIFFYYSGHARAEALDLGAEGLALTELRQRLFAVPATLTVVVLDACQSGAFSRIKGAQPAADFSFNSRRQLDSTGVAVLASSTGSELSQESEQLRSSYFTHHLLVGMRGAGDANGDGQVSVDEAYRYAYHQTLLATAATAVGGQHVTLEVDLKGHGEVPLSYPRAATASIELPSALEGQALVQDKRAKAVVAETYKAKGAAVRIAVAPGDYEVTVRQGTKLLRCQVVAPGTVVLDRCTTEAISVDSKKGGRFIPTWRFELVAGSGQERQTEFTRTLRDFGYQEDASSASEVSISAGRDLFGHGEYVGGFLSFVQAPGWRRETELEPLRFSWNTTTIGAMGHLEHPLWRQLFVYLDVAAGLGIGRTRFIDQDGKTLTNTYFGPSAFAGGGLGFHHVIVNELALTMGMRVGWAPVIENDIGTTHDSGGTFLGIGLSYARGGSR
ncbi:MAG: peptidase caspase catalytic subunit p20 [Deltaproteobacteria bacterium]|nr:peptidase caspase catalytic subunit p20 [Deltaproteobacteria bacterium]